MKLTVSNKTTIHHPPTWLREELRRRLTFPNPAYEEAERMGRWTGDISPILSCFMARGDAVTVPRGFTRQLIRLLRKRGARYDLDDRRRELPPVGFTFVGRLRDYQEEAVEAVLSRDFGVLTAPTGSGKTVMALKVIAERRQPTIIVVHTKELADQWAERIETFLGIPRKEVGRIGGGKKTTGPLTVAMVQTLYKCADEAAPRFGHLIVDECHRIPSRTFTEAVTAFDCKFMLGLSATPWRRDKLSRLIYWHLGDKVHEVDRDRLLDSGAILPADVVVRETAFTTELDPSTEYTRMLTELTQDPGRNHQIAQDVVELARAMPGTILVLSDRKAHVEKLAELIRVLGVSCETLTGDMPEQERQILVADLSRGWVKVLVATGQLIGEGFDCAGLHALVLATPIKFSGRLLQYLGRVLRPAPGKDRALVLDYLDHHVGVLRAAHKARMRVFRQASEAA